MFLKCRLSITSIILLGIWSLIGCQMDEEIIYPKQEEKLTLERYLRFDAETYEKLGSDEMFLKICELYMQYQKHTLSADISFDSIIHLAQNYGRTLDYCRDNSLMLYVFKNYQEKTAVPKVRSECDEVIVEADWEYLKGPYKFVYTQVMRAKTGLLEEIVPWGGTEELLTRVFKAYTIKEDTRLYWYMAATGPEVRRISDLLSVLKECTFPGQFEGYLVRYDVTFMDVIRWAREELRFLLLGEGSHAVDSGSGSSSGSSGTEGSSVTMANFIQNVLTTEFRNLILSELGIDISKILIKFDNGKLSPLANAGYIDTDGTIYISSKMFSSGWSTRDMEAIMYHECIHARQHLVDRIVLERGPNGEFVTKEYVVHTTRYDIEEAWDTVYGLLDVNKIPKEGSKRDAMQEKVFEMYKSMYVDPVIESYKSQTTNIVRYNKKLIEAELDAYTRQMNRYENIMSIKLIQETEKQLRRYRDIWNKIKNQ